MDVITVRRWLMHFSSDTDYCIYLYRSVGVVCRPPIHMKILDALTRFCLKAHVFYRISGSCFINCIIIFAIGGGNTDFIEFNSPIIRATSAVNDARAHATFCFRSKILRVLTSFTRTLLFLLSFLLCHKVKSLYVEAREILLQQSDKWEV